MKNTEKSKSKTQWHELLGAFLKELLSPVNIHVETEAKVMTESPRIDILSTEAQVFRYFVCRKGQP